MIFQKHKSAGRVFWYILFPSHLILLSLLYAKFGFNLSQEGDKYLSDAQNLISGNFSKAFEFQWFSSAYIIYLSLFLLVKTPPALILFFTYTINLLACLSFYKMLREQISELNAKVWLTLTLLSPMLQFWQFNLFSETFFISVSLLFISAAFKSDAKNNMVKLFLLALILIFTRPGGILIVAPTAAFYLQQNKLLNKKLLISTCIIFGLLLAYLIIFKMKLHYAGVSREVAGGAIYAGFPTLGPSNFPEGRYTLWNCYQNIIERYDFAALMGLFYKKWLSFFVVTRPYYTAFHNYINSFHYIFYGLCAIGIFLSIKLKYLRTSFYLTFLGIILLNSVMVALTFNEWSERYTVQVFPFIFVLSAFPISIAIHKIKEKYAV